MIEWFTYDPAHPLLFTQFYFWAFFAIVYAGFALIMQRAGSSRARLHARNIYLMAASWFFYYKTSGIFLLILAFITISDFLIGQQIPRSKRPKLWLILSVCIDLSLLFYFKYAYFFTNIFNDVFGTNVQVFDIFAFIGNGFSHDGRFLANCHIL